MDLVGWQQGSWGYHSDDGSVISANVAVDTGLDYGAGKTVGMTVDMVKQRAAAFTLDGERVGKSKFSRILSIERCQPPLTSHVCLSFFPPSGKVLEHVSGQLFPAVSFQQGGPGMARVRVNFGPEGGSSIPFKYKPAVL